MSDPKNAMVYKEWTVTATSKGIVGEEPPENNTKERLAKLEAESERQSKRIDELEKRVAELEDEKERRNYGEEF